MNKKKKKYLAPVAEVHYVRIEKGYMLSMTEPNREPFSESETDGEWTEELGPGWTVGF